MTKDTLLAQILAQIPDCPHYLASAYLIEFIERLRNSGQQQLVTITKLSNEGHAARLPDEVMSVQKIYANGLELSPTMTQNEAIYELYTYDGLYNLTDEDGNILTDEGDNYLTDGV